jgi:putative transposase
LGQVVSRAVVIATGITANGDREVLGVDIGDSEDETFWTRFLRSLRDRGLNGVRLVISDAHAGLKASIRKCFTGSSWQRCRVHFARNLLATVPKAHAEFVAAAFRSIFALGTPTEVSARWDEVATTLADRFPKAAGLMTDAKTDVLAFTAFPRVKRPRFRAASLLSWKDANHAEEDRSGGQGALRAPGPRPHAGVPVVDRGC